MINTIRESIKKYKHESLLFDQSFNDGHLGGCNVDGDPGTECPKMWKYIVDKYNIKSVLDIGCGFGYHLKYFKDFLGLEVQGVEGSKIARDVSFFPEKILAHDYTTGPSDLTGSFDLCWSVEFVEHVDELGVHNFMKDFDKSKCVIMTHALPGQSGHNHVNCQPFTYWKQIFSEYGFIFDEDETNKIRKIAMEDFNDFRNWQSQTGEREYRGPAAVANKNVGFLVPHVAENALFFYKP
jgi:SAM-dependent methyltransferase